MAKKLDLINMLISIPIQMTPVNPEVRLPKEGQDTAQGAVQAQVQKEFLVEVLLGNLLSKIREGHRGVSWVILHAEPPNLLPQTMARLCQEALLWMALQSASEKGVASLSNTPLHVGTVLHLQTVCLEVPTVIVEEIFMKGTVIGIQATEVIMSAHHVDGTEAHGEAEALQDTVAGEVEVGALLAVQLVIEVITGIITVAGVQ